MQSNSDYCDYNLYTQAMDFHTLKINGITKRQYQQLVINRRLAENILVILLQYIGLMLSLFTPSPAPLWLAAGTACAFVFLRGYTILPGIWLGNFIAYLLAGVNVSASFASASVNAMQTFLLFWLCHTYICPTLLFYRMKDFSKFILCAGALTSAAAALLVYIFNSLFRSVSSPFQLWLHWWLADLNGILLVSLAVIAWDAYFPQMEAFKKINKYFLYGLYGLLFVFIMLFLTSYNSVHALIFILLAFPIMLIISRKYGWCGAVSSLFMLGISLIVGAYLGMMVFNLPASMFIFLEFVLLIETIMVLAFRV